MKNSGTVGSFHENKIRQLELFMNDVINLDMINKSKAFAKFIEFNKYYDEETELSMTMRQRFKNDLREKKFEDEDINNINNMKNSNIDDDFEK